MEIRINPALNRLLFAISWCIYVLWLIPYTDQVTDECSGTPSHNFSNSVFIVPIYFVLFGYWIFQVFRHLALRQRLFLSLLILLLVPMLLAVIINSIALNSSMVNLVGDSSLFQLIYDYGCYQELELRNAILIPGIAIAIVITLNVSARKLIKSKISQRVP